MILLLETLNPNKSLVNFMMYLLSANKTAKVFDSYENFKIYKHFNDNLTFKAYAVNADRH